MLTIVSAGSAAAFPQISGNRTRASIINLISAYAGGQSSTHALDRARLALDQATREFNTWAWNFNRMSQTINWVANTNDYLMNSDVRSMRQATLLNAAGIQVGNLEYRPWAAFTVEFDVRLGTSAYPTHYTFRNLHETGLLTIQPPMAAVPSTAYPAAQFEYHRRILLPTDDTSVFDIPQEVEEALVQTAIAIFLGIVRTFEEATTARNLADRIKFALEAEYRDYPDSRTEG